MVIPLWLKIVGPLVLLAMIVGGVKAYGHHQYSSGHKDGVAEVDAQWAAADAKLKEDAAKSATRADDLAAKRAEEHHAQADSDRKAVEDAAANNTSPLDALFR